MKSIINASRALGTELTSESGQGMVEYALLLGLIAIVALVAIKSVGDNTSAEFKAIAGEIPTSAPTA